MHAEATSEAFFELFAQANPFLDNRVVGPSPAGADVPAIHRAAFDRLVGLTRQAHAAHRGLGALLAGEAGVGKSHLLARLGRWAEDGNAYFICLHNLQSPPDGLGRAVLHGTVSQLTWGRRDRFHPTPLYELARAGLLDAAGGAGRYGWRQLERAYQRWLDEHGPEFGDRLVYQVLFVFFRSATAAMRGKDDGSVAALLVRWLSGGALDPVEGRLALLPPGPRRDDPIALADGQPLLNALAALARLARAQGRTFILALDQVENLDADQFAALSRFLEALLDAAPNLLVITSGLAAALDRWHADGVAAPSAWDRLAQFEVRLPALSADQAEQLLRGRLEAFLAPFLFCEELTRHYHPAALFPLGGRWARQALAGGARPREVINLARDRWQAQQAALARLGPQAWLEGWPGDADLPAAPPAEEAPSIDTVPVRRARETSHGDVVLGRQEGGA